MIRGLISIVPLLTGTVAALLGLLVVIPMRRRPARWALTVALFGMALLEAGTWVVARSPGSLASFGGRVLVFGEGLMILGWVLFGVVFARDDRAVRLRAGRGMAALAGALAVLLAALMTDPFQVVTTPDGRLSLVLTPLGRLHAAATLLGAAVALAGIERAFGVMRGEVRRKSTLFLLGLAGALGFHVFLLSEALLFAARDVGRLWMEAVAFLLSLGLMGFGLVRHRLLEVQLFVSRHVVYRSLAIVVVGSYLLGLGVAGELMRWFGIPLKYSVAVLAVFTSALALTFVLSSERTRRRVRRFVDTHFYQSKYDYRREWTGFTRKLTSVVSLEAILPRIAETLVETLGLQRVAIFLGEEGAFRAVESVGTPGVAPRVPADPALWSFLVEATEPVSLADLPPGPLDEAVSSLQSLGLTAMVPLVAKGEMVGLLAVGPPADGAPFTYEDHDLLATMAAQAATAILNARLAEQLARTRELEALHRVSSFALHDLKNLVATLSLVVQNAAERGADAAFQRDALRAVEGSVRQMRELIARLSDLPKRLDLRLEPTDVNHVVRATLEQAKPVLGRHVKLVTDLRPVPTVLADEEHLQKALYNLVINAVEAIPGGGEVRIRTAAPNGAVLLEVEDTGQGIPAPLLDRGLFTPFRSTKRRGLGIGLYQVKTIVEAHVARISVDSRPGQGTTFRVDFPAAVARPVVGGPTPAVVAAGSGTLESGRGTA